MNKKSLIIMCVALVVVAAALIGMVALRFGGERPSDKETLSDESAPENVGNNVAANDNTNEDETKDGFINEIPDADKIDKLGEEELIVEIQVSEGTTASLGVVEGGNDGSVEEDFGGNDSSGNSNNSGDTGNSEGTTEDEENSTENTDNGTTEEDDESSENADIGVTEGENEENIEDEEVDVPNRSEVTYESYNAMSGDEQQEFINSFDSIPEFVAWYNAAKAEYEAEHPSTEIGGDGVVDAGQIG